MVIMAIPLMLFFIGEAALSRSSPKVVDDDDRFVR